MSKSDFLFIGGIQWFTISLIFQQNNDLSYFAVALAISALSIIGSALKKNGY